MPKRFPAWRALIALLFFTAIFFAARFNLFDIEWRCIQLGGGVWDPEKRECVGISLTPATCAQWEGQVDAATQMCNGARPRKLYCDLFSGRWDDEAGICNAMPIKSPRRLRLHQPLCSSMTAQT